MLASVEQLIQSGAAAGYPLTRLVGHHMEWLFLDKPAVTNLVEYEARLNHVLSKYNDAVICNYDLISGRLRPMAAALIDANVCVLALADNRLDFATARDAASRIVKDVV